MNFGNKKTKFLILAATLATCIYGFLLYQKYYPPKIGGFIAAQNLEYGDRVGMFRDGLNYVWIEGENKISLNRYFGSTVHENGHETFYSYFVNGNGDLLIILRHDDSNIDGTPKPNPWSPNMSVFKKSENGDLVKYRVWAPVFPERIITFKEK